MSTAARRARFAMPPHRTRRAETRAAGTRSRGLWSRPLSRGLRARGAVVALLLSSASGCVLVKPSQRALLARPEMDPSTDGSEDVFHSHVEAAREGGFGGHGTQGGGCGCG